MFLPALLVLAQLGTERTPLLHGRVISEATGAALAGAIVTPASEWGLVAYITTKEDGRFAFVPDPDTATTRRRPGQNKLHDDEMRIERAGYAPVIVDTAAEAPWAFDVPLRPTRTLRGTIQGARPGEAVTVALPESDFAWPPQTDLVISLKPLETTVGDDGRFEIPNVPALTKLDVWVGRNRDARHAGLCAIGVDGPDSIELEVPATTVAAPAADESAWKLIQPVPSTINGQSRFTAWFEVFPDARHVWHTNGGGRWHVHGNRACNCIEALVGSHVVVARDRYGWIGMSRFDVQPATLGHRPRVILAAGGLLRLHVDGAMKTAHVSLMSNNRAFVVRDVPGHALWYELAPEGSIDVVVEGGGAAIPRRTVVVKAGEVTRVEIAP